MMAVKRHLFVICVLMMATCRINAYDFVSDGLCYNIIDDNGTKYAQVTQGADWQSGYNGTVVIPASVTYQGVSYSVTSIDDLAFVDYDDLVSVSLPNTMRKIGTEAFFNCVNLTSVNFPESLTTIEDEAFYNCGLTSVYIPKSVTSIDRNVFSCCSHLSSIIVDPANEVYDSRQNCNAIINTDECTLVTGCLNTVIPSKIYEIGPSAFNGCTGLVAINIPNELNHISSYAFRNCVNLSSITFPSNLKRLEDGAFDGCSSLSSIVIPERVYYVGVNPFSNCSGITSITVDPNNTSFDTRNDCHAIIDIKKNVLLTGCQNTVIPEGVVTIGENAFRGCTALSSISIPDGVTLVSSNAFKDCTSLVSVSIPNSVTKIYGGSFEGCTSLETFVIPEGVTALQSLFQGCENLKSVVIPVGITRINNTAFNGCKNLESLVVTEGNTVYDSRNNCNAIIETATNKLVVGCKTTVIPVDVVEIGNYAFKGSENLTTMTIPDGVTTLDAAVFEGCSSLANVTLSKNLTSLGQRVFENCTSLKELIIPNGVTRLENSIFRGCNSLVSVTLPDMLTYIGSMVFSGTAIKAITFPATLNDLGYRAFHKCQDLTDVTVKTATPVAIEDDTFYKRSEITLYVPEGSKATYEVAAVWKDFKEIKEGLGPDNTSFLLGDANGDGNLTIADYTAIAHYILGIVSSNFNKKAADVNNDGKINVADCTAVAHLLLYGTIEKPASIRDDKTMLMIE